MKSALVRIRLRTSIIATVALVAATACGPSDIVGKEALKPIKEGMTMAQVDSIIGQGQLEPRQPADSLRLHHGYRTEVYLIEGQRYTILWYRDKPGTIEDAVTRQTDTPILFQGDQVLAKGWSAFDAKAEKINMPNPYRSRERLDSIAESQSKH